MSLLGRTPQKPDDKHQDGERRHNAPDDEEQQKHPCRLTCQAIGAWKEAGSCRDHEPGHANQNDEWQAQKNDRSHYERRL